MRVLLTLLLFLAFCVPVQAVSRNWRNCESADPDLSIKGCTSILKRSKRSSKNLVKAYFNRASAYSKKDMYDQAIKDYTEVIRLDPKMAEGYNNRGIAYYTSKQYDPAIEDFTIVIRLKTEKAGAYYLRGNTYHSKGLYDRAIEDYTSAIKLEPKDIDLYFNRGNAYGSNDQWEYAAKDFEQALKLEGEPVAALHKYIARAWLRAGKAAYGLRDAETAVSLRAKDSSGWELLGSIHEAIGDKGKAIKAYRKAKALDPKLKAVQEHLKRLGELP